MPMKRKFSWDFVLNFEPINKVITLDPKICLNLISKAEELTLSVIALTAYIYIYIYTVNAFLVSGIAERG